jgi:hypothetical protein
LEMKMLVYFMATIFSPFWSIVPEKSGNPGYVTCWCWANQTKRTDVASEIAARLSSNKRRIRFFGPFSH